MNVLTRRALAMAVVTWDCAAAKQDGLVVAVRHRHDAHRIATAPVAGALTASVAARTAMPVQLATRLSACTHATAMEIAIMAVALAMTVGMARNAANKCR